MYRCCIFVMLLIALAQSSLIAQSIPTSMAECDAGFCETGQLGASTWTFNGKEGTMVWPAVHQTATLKIQQWDSSGVVIVRDDTAGPTVGLHVVYKGKMNDHRIDGDAVWNLPSKGPETHQVKWHAIFNTGPSFVVAKQPSLNGVWHIILPQTPGVVYRFNITQTGDQVRATWIDTHSWKDGKVQFQGRFVSATTIDGEVMAGNSTEQNIRMLKGYLTLDGPNRFLGSMGGVADRGQGPPSNPQSRQAQQARMGPPSMLGSLLWGLVASAMQPVTPASRVSYLEGLAHRQCPPTGPNSDSCYSERSGAQDELDEARAKLGQEIQDLLQIKKQLSAQCTAGNHAACEKLNQVAQQLSDDQDIMVFGTTIN